MHYRVRIYIEEPAPLLTWTQMREMQESGWVSFGAHTMYRPDLGKLAAPQQEQHEVGECRTSLEQQLGRPVSIIAYSLGRVGDHGLSAVKSAGYDCAITTMPDVNNPRSDPYLLWSRILSVDKHWLVVTAETAGVWQFFSRQMHFTTSTVPTPSISKTNLIQPTEVDTFISRSAL